MKNKNTYKIQEKAQKKRKTNRKKMSGKIRFLIVLAVLFLLAVCAGIFCIAVNRHILNSTKDKIYPAVNAENAELPDGAFDCIFILGCGVYEDGTPSPMLRDRLFTGASLYDAGLAPKIIVSGDHGREDYDEVNTMRNVLVSMGVPEEDVFMDHAGFSTYDSLYRADYIFGVKKAVIVTQDFHLPRAVYIAGQRGIDAVGVTADQYEYAGVRYNYSREIPARIKDFFACAFGVKPKYLGEQISLDQSGSVTADKKG